MMMRIIENMILCKSLSVKSPFRNCVWLLSGPSLVANVTRWSSRVATAPGTMGVITDVAA
jgi:alanine-alpha-ketoisovalerate/valine-pyruvate aminotransferase